MKIILKIKEYLDPAIIIAVCLFNAGEYFYSAKETLLDSPKYDAIASVVLLFLLFYSVYEARERIIDQIKHKYQRRIES